MNNLILSRLNPKRDFFNMISLSFSRNQIHLEQLDQLELTRDKDLYSLNTIKALRLINAIKINNKQILEKLDILSQEIEFGEIVVKN